MISLQGEGCHEDPRHIQDWAVLCLVFSTKNSYASLPTKWPWPWPWHVGRWDTARMATDSSSICTYAVFPSMKPSKVVYRSVPPRRNLTKDSSEHLGERIQHILTRKSDVLLDKSFETHIRIIGDLIWRHSSVFKCQFQQVTAPGTLQCLLSHTVSFVSLDCISNKALPG